MVLISVAIDANIFYYLESWVANPTDPSATYYLTQMELYQRHITTAAFKLAGGVDLSSTSLTKVVKQNPIASAFVTKITKAFLDALYAFLDGLVHLASDESPIVSGKRSAVGASTSSGTNPLELLDLSDGVRAHCSLYWTTDSTFSVGHSITVDSVEFRASFEFDHPEYDLAARERIWDLNSR